MSELTVEQIIKLVVGALVVVAVVAGLYFIFKDKILDFFGGLPGVNSTSGLWRILF